MIKKLLLLVLIFITAMSCNKDKAHSEKITIDPALGATPIIAVPTSAGISTFSLTTTTAWTITVADNPTASAATDWVTVSPSSGGAGKHVITVDTDANTTNEARVATLTVKSGDLIEEITVTQAVLSTITEGVLPVVFHVLFDNNPPIGTLQNPSNDVFVRRIMELNEFYKSKFFPSANSTAVNVTFALASQYPNGITMEESGVNRIHYPRLSDMSMLDFMSAGLDGNPLTSSQKEILWDPNRYINIWLFSFDSETENGVTGVSYLPYQTSANPLFMLSDGDWAITNLPEYMHGIALNNYYFSPSSSSGIPADAGRATLCHEMGHYLGLFHAFIEPNLDGTSPGCGVDSKDNASDDGCSDTPKYDRIVYEKWLNDNMSASTEEAILRQPCDGGPEFRSTNIMDYYVTAHANITPQQRDRIEHVIAYSPWIPRSKVARGMLFSKFKGDVTDKRPVPTLMY